MLSFLKKKSNVFATTVSFVDLLGVKINNSTLRDSLENHPDFPSLFAISDCLSEFGVSNQSYGLDPENVESEDLLLPFIAHLNTDGGIFVCVITFTATEVIIIDEGRKKRFLTSEFRKVWTGVALHANANENSGEPSYKINRAKAILKTLWFLASFVVFFLLSAIYFVDAHSNDILSLSYLLLNFLGLFISILLLAHSVNNKNPLINKLCSISGKSGCSSILTSAGSQLTPWLSWSEVGFFFFSGACLVQITNDSHIPLLMLFSLLASPYIIYSLTYQYLKGQWCVLCCITQCILLLGATASVIRLHTIEKILQINLRDGVEVILGYLIPITIWGAVKPLVVSHLKVEPLKRQLNKFKYNTNLFKVTLSGQPKYLLANDVSPLVLGNQEAEQVITIISNPVCQPCSDAHKLIQTWLAFKTDLRVNVILSAPYENDYVRNRVSKHLQALSLQCDSRVVENAIHSWYEDKDKDYDKWAADYPVIFTGQEDDVKRKHNSWCDFVGMEYTPLIFINGVKLPPPYQLDDLRYLLN